MPEAATRRGLPGQLNWLWLTVLVISKQESDRVPVRNRRVVMGEPRSIVLLSRTPLNGRRLTHYT